MNVKPVNIGNKFVGPGYPCYIIAEIGINHNGDLEIAKKLISLGKQSFNDDRVYFGLINDDLESVLSKKIDSIFLIYLIYFSCQIQLLFY
jgi:sialic acid synthase SpsE